MFFTRNNFFYDKLIGRHTQRVSFRILASFLLTFVIARIYVLSATFGVFEDPYIYVRGYHIHHLNYGIFIMAVAGFWALIFQEQKNRLRIGTLYGVGLGLTFDEFGMWMKLDDYYWTRMSYDAIVIIALLFTSFVYFPSFWYFWINRIEKRIQKLKKIKS
jgi:hypothetical protein